MSRNGENSSSDTQASQEQTGPSEIRPQSNKILSTLASRLSSVTGPVASPRHLQRSSFTRPSLRASTTRCSSAATKPTSRCLMTLTNSRKMPWGEEQQVKLMLLERLMMENPYEMKADTTMSLPKPSLLDRLSDIESWNLERLQKTKTVTKSKFTSTSAPSRGIEKSQRCLSLNSLCRYKKPSLYSRISQGTSNELKPRCSTAENHILSFPTQNGQISSQENPSILTTYSQECTPSRTTTEIVNPLVKVWSSSINMSSSVQICHNVRY